ncbi:polysaccharide pyruvyl transferase family protein [Microbacterium sp. NPDC055910]|uniref:polysaccharide pyruvyl transferase family protein n=1 Tax=Microbacterium sp. NPDC055910 TaxID=3345659 RepID=UPI0035D5869B
MTALRILVVSADRSDAGGAPINLGDAFLTDVLLAELVERGHRAEAVDFGGPRLFGSGPRRHLSGVKELFRAIRQSDAVIVGGGTLLQDDGGRSWGGLPRLCAAVSALAWAARRPLVFFAVGSDTVTRKIPRLLLRLAVRGRTVWVRDTASLERVREQLRGNAELAADAVLLAAADSLISGVPSSDAKTPRDVVALSYKHTDRLKESYFARPNPGTAPSPLFLAMSQSESFADATPKLRERVGGRADFTPHPIGWPAALETIAHARAVHASRMHALYLALLTSVPMVAIGDSEKVTAFAHEFGVPRSSDLDVSVSARAARADEERIQRARERVNLGLSFALESLVTT